MKGSHVFQLSGRQIVDVQKYSVLICRNGGQVDAWERGVTGVIYISFLLLLIRKVLRDDAFACRMVSKNKRHSIAEPPPRDYFGSTPRPTPLP
jgi:hypothetical protein